MEVKHGEIDVDAKSRRSVVWVNFAHIFNGCFCCSISLVGLN